MEEKMAFPAFDFKHFFGGVRRRHELSELYFVVFGMAYGLPRSLLAFPRGGEMHADCKRLDDELMLLKLQRHVQFRRALPWNGGE